MHAAAVEISAPPVRRKRRVVAILLLLVLGGWFARFAYLRITLEPTPRPEYWAEKIAALDPPPAGALPENAILSLLADRPFEVAYSAATSTQPYMYQGDPTAPLRGPWDATRIDIVEVGKVFESSEFIQLRRQLIDATHRGWNIRVTPTPTPALSHFSPFRAWVKWLVAHSRWSIEHAGDPESAAEDWRTVLRMCREIERGGIVINRLVAIGCVALLSREMILDSKDAPAGTAGRLIEYVDALGSHERTFVGEQYFIDSTLEYRYVREGGNWLAVNHAATFYGAAVPPSAVWNITSPIFYDLETARKKVADMFQSTAECRDLVTAARKYRDVRGGPDLGALVGERGWSSRLLTRMALLDFRARAEGEGSVTILALEEYRKRNGHYPGELRELVPGFLPRLPIDTADGQALRYRRTDAGFVLYSIAENGKDDGGVIMRTGSQIDREPRWERDADFIFTDIRRQPVSN